MRTFVTSSICSNIVYMYFPIFWIRSLDQVQPPDQVHPPGARYTPPGPGTPPLGPGTPPGAEHAGRYGQRAGGTHPTGMQSCLYLFLEEN